jgi:hypothetical protein
MDNLTNYFWIYLALFVCGSIAGMIYQSRHNDTDHEMLKNDKNYVDSDDHFAAVVKKINNK